KIRASQDELGPRWPIRCLQYPFVAGAGLSVHFLRRVPLNWRDLVRARPTVSPRNLAPGSERDHDRHLIDEILHALDLGFTIENPERRDHSQFGLRCGAASAPIRSLDPRDFGS